MSSHMDVFSNSQFRDQFLYAAARAFFVSSYADFVEDPDNKDDYPRPGGGEDWMFFAPDAPSSRSQRRH